MNSQSRYNKICKFLEEIENTLKNFEQLGMNQLRVSNFSLFYYKLISIDSNKGKRKEDNISRESYKTFKKNEIKLWTIR